MSLFAGENKAFILKISEPTKKIVKNSILFSYSNKVATIIVFIKGIKIYRMIQVKTVAMLS